MTSLRANAHFSLYTKYTPSQSFVKRSSNKALMYNCELSLLSVLLFFIECTRNYERRRKKIYFFNEAWVVDNELSVTLMTVNTCST